VSVASGVSIDGSTGALLVAGESVPDRALVRTGGRVRHSGRAQRAHRDGRERRQLVCTGTDAWSLELIAREVAAEKQLHAAASGAQLLTTSFARCTGLLFPGFGRAEGAISFSVDGRSIFRTAGGVRGPARGLASRA